MDYKYSRFIDPYINKILNNEIPHCKEQRLMIDNIVIPILERDDVIVDDDKIEKGLELQKYFPYKLIEWEIFLFALIVGVFFKNGNIVFTEVLILIGRGAGKNGFISFLSFYFLSPLHGIRGYNIDILANTLEQAQTTFKDIYDIVKIDKKAKKNNLEKNLENNFLAGKDFIEGKKTKSVLRTNSGGKKGKDSKRTGCIIFDEKHEYDDSSNMNTLISGMGKVWHGRIITITTNGHIRGGILDKELEQARDILREYNDLNRKLIFWCKIEDEKEWKDPNMWIKANPSINDFLSLKDTLQKEVLEMKYKPEYYPEFLAKRLNFPVGNSEIEVASWGDICATKKEFDIKILDNKSCVGGVDYAKTNDFVAVGLLFKLEDKHYFIQHTFVCMKSRDLVGIKAPLDEWANKGDITFVNDVEINPNLVVEWFMEKSKKYNIVQIGIDNFRFSLLNSTFKKYGFDAYEKKNIKLIRPNDIIKTAPIINSMFINQNLIFDSEIMKWYTNNTKKIINNGNITYGKIEPNYRKTDGFMAFVNAVAIKDNIKEVVFPSLLKVLKF